MTNKSVVVNTNNKELEVIGSIGNKPEAIKAPCDYIANIGGVNYLIEVHFNNNSSMTLSDKIKKMNRNLGCNMNC